MSNASTPAPPLGIVGLDLDIRSGDAVFVAGDLGLVAGAAYAAQRFALIATTTPGALLFHPTFGAGLGDQSGEPFTEARRQEVITRMAQAVGAEPYVQSVDSVDADMLDDGTLQIITTWLPLGGGLSQTVTTIVGTPVTAI